MPTTLRFTHYLGERRKTHRRGAAEERKEPMNKRQAQATAAIAATAVAATATIALTAMAITMNNTDEATQPANEQQAPDNETLTISPADRTLFDRDLERSQSRRRNHCRDHRHARQRAISGGRDGNDAGQHRNDTGQPCTDKADKADK